MARRFCSECGKEIPAVAMFCLDCGARQKNPLTAGVEDMEGPEDGVYCPHCGKKVSKASEFCLWGGNELKKRPEGDIFCPECGQKNKNDAKFCESCGFSLVDYFGTGAGAGSAEVGQGKVLAGRYELKHKLGAGGFGEVWLARDRQLEHEVAMKMIPSDIADQKRAISNLLREAKIAIKLAHPRIARLYNLERTETGAFLLMEYVEGQTLDDLLSDKVLLPEEEAVRIGTQVLEALAYAHEIHVVHRDLKPANIMVQPDGDIKILDFGIAIAMQETVTRFSKTSFSASSGTLTYMAPEQVKGDTQGAFTDVYAFGVLMYEMLTGRPPFYSGDIQGQIMKKLPTKPGNITNRLWGVIARCLEKDPKRRIQDAGAVLAALQGRTPRPQAPAPVAKKEVVQQPVSPVAKPGARSGPKGVSDDVKAFLIEYNIVFLNKNQPVDRLNHVIFQAVEANKPDVITWLVAHGADPNTRDKNGCVPLHFAAEGNKIDALKALLEKDIDVNAADDTGRSPLHAAVKNGHTDAVKWLMANGADINMRDKEGQTPLYMAVAAKNTEMANWLMKHQADVKIGAKGQSPLHLAVKNKDLAIMKWLLVYGADINDRNASGETPLHLAISLNDTKSIEWLVKHDADVNIAANNGYTALFNAVEQGDRKLAEFLMDHGADLNAKDKNVQTPLDLAVKKGDWDIIKAVIFKGIDHGLVLPDKGNALMEVAALQKDWKTVEFLLDHGADPNARAKEGQTLLQIAVEHEDLKNIDMLLGHGADVNMAAEDGRTALHFAVDQGNKEPVEFLIEHGADLNTKDKNGHTVLSLAMQKGDWNLVKIIIIKGLDHGLALPDKGNRLMEVAALQKDWKTVEFLIDHGADVNTRYQDGRTLLHLAAEQGAKKATKMLLRHSADMNIRDQEGEAALEGAIKAGKNSFVMDTMDNQDLAQRLDDKGVGMLSIAAITGAWEMVEFLVRHGLSPNVKDLPPDNTTLLHLAVEAEEKAVVDALTAYEVNVNALDARGMSPLDVCTNDGIRESLKKAGAHMGPVHKKHVLRLTGIILGMAIIIATAITGSVIYDNHKVFMEYIYNLGVPEPEPRTTEEKTAYQKAVDAALGRVLADSSSFESKKDALEWLIVHGANVNAKDGKGRFLSMTALRNKDTDLVSWLLSHGAKCGDGKCRGNENCASCPKDCGECCGNGVCDTEYGENCSICAKDCGCKKGLFCRRGKCIISHHVTIGRLMWQDPPAQKDMSWSQAKKYCRALVLDGYDDWRLPTIMELRSLIRGCSKTRTGGPCKVTNQCRNASCFNYACNGCAAFKGSGRGGYYWPRSLHKGPASWFWSSSSVAGNSKVAWDVDFGYGVVGIDGKDSDGGARCVRLGP